MGFAIDLEPTCASALGQYEDDAYEVHRATSINTVKFTPFPEDQQEVELVNDDGLVKEKLHLSDVDPIFAESFR